MKIVSQNRYGGPEVMKLEEIEQPTVDRHSIVVRVEAVAVSAADTQFRQGKPLPARLLTGLFRPKRLVLGGFFSGVVHAVGPDVKGFAVGEPVFGATPNFLGATAEFIKLPDNAPIVRRPEQLDPAGAATLAYSFTSAMPMMRDSAKIRAGAKVLVLGASGSVGLAAVQIAKYFGAWVTGMCSEDKASVVRSAGADTVLDSRNTDLSSSPAAFDVILDASGKASFARSQHALKRGGVYVASLPTAAIALQAMAKFGRKRVSFPMTALRHKKAILADLKLLAELAAAGKIVPTVGRSFSIEDVQQAHRWAESRQKTGDVVIRLC